ncbi:hypothetical protein MHF_0567 [Mycoplasma haemofelis Ohio2]|uniref:Uncharacterized protein n=1 Tax=Mycoplasma haemofelis (strain Ohio2) TaxID=859194 RepID=F6FHZ1_MYCHI|nr:hypothetical protein MHF_0567 [Mycoplasma haemofelis Ohio2]
MSKSLALSLGTLGVGGAGLGAAGLHYWKNTPTSPKVTFSVKYSKALLNDETGDDIWTSKLTALALETSNPKNPHLIRAKEEHKSNEKDRAKVSLKQGCQAIYSKSVDSRDDFDDFKNFCSLNNKDKISKGKSLVSAAGDFDTHWSTFSGAKRDDLYGGFKEIHDGKGSEATDNNWKDKMLKECGKISEDIFDGEIVDFTKFCTKDKSQQATVN